MRFSTIVTTTSLLGAAMAAPAVHQHKEKRAVVTTTIETHKTVTVNAINNNVVAPTQVAALDATVVEAAQKDAVADVASPKAAAAVSTQAAVSAAASTASTASSSTKSDDSTEMAASDVKGVTYTPYNADGTCKSPDQVASDLSSLKDFPVIRLYGTDCNQVENVYKGKTSSQKLFLGVYYVDQIQASVDTIKAAVEKYGSWDDVVTVSIGNELVNSNQATPSQVGQYVATGRSALTSAGYTGPVVSVDTFISVINNPELCKYSDYMAVNAHAYFDKNTVAQDSGDWLLQQIQRVWTACDGAKDVVITESGWPSKGETYGVAVPSKANQADAVNSIKKVCGSSTYLFTAFNDYWKADGPYGVEKYFGILSDE
ncbi:putative family 17 glucosidase NDAI_0B00620 [Naumovozyma dairenensis CBS 421]|uniref:Glycoside hydrolase family 17 protein n=1 Tax=Naumovozyma dairenensis (strain ATCC 10597 / BCRC 20456 / CBS 421 / NBRC 0211 / NRRL Y-12639) TaxID=1071378 RepID=G0W5N5_NAUDC|nr:hypothetical protein NDAI_0B00620 [Naumovozyma dairenensis CBS 421]CCD23096.1 hypothetical protein NDAI_0B00620 [Naumovozyma dairenensis CBS 421]